MVDLYFESTDAGSFGVLSLSPLATALLEGYSPILSPKEAIALATLASEKGLVWIVR